MAVARKAAASSIGFPGDTPFTTGAGGSPAAPWYQLLRGLWLRTGGQSGINGIQLTSDVAGLQALAALTPQARPVQATALPYAITPTPSPFAYQADVSGTVLIAGGTVSDVEFSRDGATSFAFPLAGPIPVHQGDVVTITYTVAPTLTMIPA